MEKTNQVPITPLNNGKKKKQNKHIYVFSARMKITT